MSKNSKGTLNRKKRRIAGTIMDTARECGYTVEGINTKFYLSSKYLHAADYCVEYNHSSGYFEGFIFIEKMWLPPMNANIIRPDGFYHDGVTVEGWSHGLWSIRNTMDANAFCNIISASMALRGKSKLRIKHNVAA